MKAIVYTKFGPPEVLQIKDVKKPVPKNNEVLVRIYATTVAKEDPDVRKAPGINGLFKPRKQILGWYFSGEIEEIGKDVQLLKQETRFMVPQEWDWAVIPNTDA